MNFDPLGLTPALLRAVGDMGLHAPTPIQAEAIPAVLRAADVWATAPTGSGKTLAFALPLVQQHVLQPRQTNFRRPIRTLVLVPTRELAVQVGDVLTNLAYQPGLKVSVVYGGVSINPQMMGLRGGADIVVATPGRLLDLVDHNAVYLGSVQHLVLDEADRLLDLGFAEELQRVLALLPAKRQTLLFSATFVPEVEALASNLLQDPVRITVDAFDGHKPDITQRAIRVDEKKRTALLRHLIAENSWKQVLVFVATRYACEHVANKLYKAGIYATPFHGEMSQGARQDVLREFKSGRWDVVVTTDLASRGIDIAMLPVVVNYDLPRSATDYTHRIGRTGRAGAHGDAVSFVTAEALAHWQLIQKRESLELTLEQIPGFEPTDEPPAPQGNGGIKGKRPSKKDKLRAAAAAQAKKTD
ncbi:DEAD/DEAH box helicase [Limnohabitans radicicola]|uniref:DEAD/DEAH box helicase n=1 Tax=Limnohabitans radicicola TaxID=2771427 RepID=A0A927FHG3_9BURK|nr:DEAD/DEAH box helicase [Limnohabitans radicicola]MBD8051480.1 DEAD/DEAH box helicase [Limnohabitans radicicola]